MHVIKTALTVATATISRIEILIMPNKSKKYSNSWPTIEALMFEWFQPLFYIVLTYHIISD